MRLTNTIRQAFVRAAMDDVPSIDYAKLQQDVAMKDALAQMPASVAKVYKEHPEWIAVSCYYVDYVGGFFAPLPKDGKLTEAAINEIRRLSNLSDEQNSARQDLRTKLRGVAASCTTRKALVEALPEFEKYLPVEAIPLSRQVPALANVLSDFVKAGWPKKNVGKIAQAAAQAA